MEKKPIPWVVARPAAFPELRSEPFLFVHMLPVILTRLEVCFILRIAITQFTRGILDLLCDGRLSLRRDHHIAATNQIFARLSRRGIDQVCRIITRER
jgi:hypothetical protein